MTANLGMPEWWTRLSGGEDADAAGKQTTILLSFMGYFWWLILGGVAEILFGGLYFGTKQSGDLHLNQPVLQLIYILLGILMVELGLGILRLRFWVYWGAFLLSIVLGGLAIYQVVRWIDGANITVETGVFTILNILFAIYNILFLLGPGVHQALQRAAPLRGEEFSPDLVIFAVIVTLPALCAALLVNYVDAHLGTLSLALIYFGGFALLIFMAYGALAKQTWSWVVSWIWVASLVTVSIAVFVRKATGSNIATEGIIASTACLLFAASVVYYLLRTDVRRTFIHWRPANSLFNPLYLGAGGALAVCAAAIYIMPGVVGSEAVALAVPGLAVGVIVGLLPNSDPITKLMAFLLGLMLAEVSYLVRGGLLPYTKWSNVIIVPLMLLVITGITALFRSTVWFVCMLLGAGTLYGLVEFEYQSVPSAYLATSGLALVSIFLGFGVGYMVSVLLGLTLNPSPAAPAEPDTKQPSHPDTAKLPAVSTPPDLDVSSESHPTAEQPAATVVSADSHKVKA